MIYAFVEAQVNLWNEGKCLHCPDLISWQISYDDTCFCWSEYGFVSTFRRLSIASNRRRFNCVLIGMIIYSPDDMDQIVCSKRTSFQGKKLLRLE